MKRVSLRRAGSTRAVASCVLATLSAGLGACTATYDITVRNDGTRSVRAELVHNPLLDRTRVLGSAMIRPGGSDRFYATGIDPFDPVELTVRPSGDSQGVPDSLRAPTGPATVVVEDAGIDSWSGLRLRVEQTPPGESD